MTIASALGIRLNNPGNIERGDPWQGLAEVQKHSRFCTFETPVWGLRAIARTLITYYDNRDAKDGSKIDTVAEIIARWAPPEDRNPTDKYAAFVAAEAGVGVKERLSVYDHATMMGIVKGIVAFENGHQPYDDATLERALELAGIPAPKKPAAKDPAVVTAAAVATTSAVGAVVQSSDTILTALNTLVPYGKGYGITFAVVSVGLALLALRYRAKERRKP